MFPLIPASDSKIMDAKFMGTLSLLVIGNFIFVNSPLYMYGFVTQKKKKKQKEDVRFQLCFQQEGNWTSLKENLSSDETSI